MALLVMRLTKPTLMTFRPLMSDSRDLCGDVIQQLNQSDLAKPRGLDYFPLGDLLLLPQNFGNIFLGETFSSYISVHNDSDQSCKDISLKTDLQTGSQRLSLTSPKAQPIPELLPDHSIDDVVHHEVKELGAHILVCAVSYAQSTGERMQFRKFFKFQVLKPLDVKTTFYNAETDEVYLEAQVQNLTPGPVLMERVTLQPSPRFTVREVVNTPIEGKEGESRGRSQRGEEEGYLSSLDRRQYLYRLSPLSPPPPPPASSSPFHDHREVVVRAATRADGNRSSSSSSSNCITVIGRLDIVWKSCMGDTGHLQTSQLQCLTPGSGDLRLTVQSVPDTVTMETTFVMVCRVTNCCDRTLDLTLSLHNLWPQGVVWCGVSRRQLRTLPRGACMDLPLSLLALSQGLQTVSGLRLTDNFLKRTYEHDDIAQVFVVDEGDTSC